MTTTSASRMKRSRFMGVHFYRHRSVAGDRSIGSRWLVPERGGWHDTCQDSRVRFSQGAAYMRTIRTLVLALAAIVLVAATPRPARAQVHLDVSLTVFHDGLSGYGDWVTHARYGEVWVPHHEHVWR